MILLDSNMGAKILLGLLFLVPVISIVLFMIGMKKWKHDRSEAKKYLIYAAIVFVLAWIGFVVLFNF